MRCLRDKEVAKVIRVLRGREREERKYVIEEMNKEKLFLLDLIDCNKDFQFSSKSGKKPLLLDSHFKRYSMTFLRREKWVAS